MIKDLINLKEKHYVVHHNGKPYAVDGIKYPWEQLADEKGIALHPISKVGIINYNEVLKVNSGKVTPEGHHLPNTSLSDLAKQL